MIWTKRRVTKLQASSSEVQARIVTLFERYILHLDRDKYAWGQFLDVARDNTQYGVYGTSAGIEVLFFGGYKRDHEIITNAINLFTTAYQDPSSLFRKKGDIFNNYKLAFWAEAIEPDKSKIDEKVMILEELIKRKIVGQGWGDYYISVDDHDLYPKILATACILFALRRYQPFESTKECEESLKWLCKRLLENGSLTIYELASSMLALNEYKNLSVKIPSIREALKQVTTKLVDWSKKRKKIEFGSSITYHYSVAMNNGRSNKYLFFLPDCLVALAFLRQGCPPEIHSYVLNVIQHYTVGVLSKNGYAPRSTGRLSSIDHLWIARLMSEFRKTNVESLVTPRIVSMLESSPITQILIALVFFGVGLWGLYAGFHFSKLQSSTPLGLLILAGLSTVIGLGVFTNFISSFISARKNI